MPEHHEYQSELFSTLVINYLSIYLSAFDFSYNFYSIIVFWLFLSSLLIDMLFFLDDFLLKDSNNVGSFFT